jgi:hypothetical protein
MVKSNSLTPTVIYHFIVEKNDNIVPRIINGDAEFTADTRG